MISFNTYIDGLDLSALKEYCVHHGRLTQYAKGDYFVKAGEVSRYIAYVSLAAVSLDKKRGNHMVTPSLCFGDPRGARTHDPNIKSVVLYLLS